MDRKRFLQTVVPAGCALLCCTRSIAEALEGAAAGRAQVPAAPPAAWTKDLRERTLEGARTPAWRRVEFGQQWVARLMEQIDSTLDAETGRKLMRNCGRACYVHSFGVRPAQEPAAGDLDQFLAAVGKKDAEIRREGDVVHYQYSGAHGSPYGLSPADGYCLCPLVETFDGPLSQTYCECSAGYVAEVFERLTTRPVRVEVLESVRRGGKVCRFRIELLKA